MAKILQTYEREKRENHVFDILNQQQTEKKS